MDVLSFGHDTRAFANAFARIHCRQKQGNTFRGAARARINRGNELKITFDLVTGFF